MIVRPVETATPTCLGAGAAEIKVRKASDCADNGGKRDREINTPGRNHGKIPLSTSQWLHPHEAAEAAGKGEDGKGKELHDPDKHQLPGRAIRIAKLHASSTMT